MDAVTYPTASVVEFVSKNVIPLRIPSDSEPLAADFMIKWTPTLIILDEDGKEHFRTVGFLTPEEFVPSIMLGIAKCHYELDRFQSAIHCIDDVLKDHPKSSAAPEAVFLRGVLGYKSTHDAMNLKKAYERLAEEYPGSEWAKKALPYRLIH